MSDQHRQAMEAVLKAAAEDVKTALAERGVADRNSEEGDLAILDVAIMHAYRIFMRIMEREGMGADAGIFADMAADLAEEIAKDTDEDRD